MTNNRRTFSEKFNKILSSGPGFMQHEVNRYALEKRLDPCSAPPRVTSEQRRKKAAFAFFGSQPIDKYNITSTSSMHRVGSSGCEVVENCGDVMSLFGGAYKVYEERKMDSQVSLS